MMIRNYHLLIKRIMIERIMMKGIMIQRQFDPEETENSAKLDHWQVNGVFVCLSLKGRWMQINSSKTSVKLSKFG